MSACARVALVTGAGSGIGREIARLLARDGTAIAAMDLNAEALGKLAAELPNGKCAWAVADVTDVHSLQSAVGELETKLGEIDLLVASAGIGHVTSALTYSAEEIERVISVNLIGVSNSIAAILPGMLKRRTGHIVGLSSLASYRGFPRMAGYCASKAGLNALLDAVRVECRPFGIHVTTICPGWVRTPMTANLDVPTPGIITAEAAARRIVEAIRKRKVFHAFPRTWARRIRLLGLLPSQTSDWLLSWLLGSLGR